MTPQLTQALQQALTESLQYLAMADLLEHKEHYVYSWNAKLKRWIGRGELRAKLKHKFHTDPIPWRTWSQQFAELLKKEHGDHLDQVGTPLGTRNFDADWLLINLVMEIVTRHGEFQASQEQLASLLTETALFFQKPTITLTFLVPLFNLEQPDEVSSVELLDGLHMRAMTEDEFTILYGGTIDRLSSTHRPWKDPRFAFVGELIMPKKLGSNGNSDLSLVHLLHKKLRKAIYAFVTFKPGAVSYNYQ